MPWPTTRTSTINICPFCFQFYIEVNYKRHVGLLLVGFEGSARELCSPNIVLNAFRLRCILGQNSAMTGQLESS